MENVAKSCKMVIRGYINHSKAGAAASGELFIEIQCCKVDVGWMSEN